MLKVFPVVLSILALITPGAAANIPTQNFANPLDDLRFSDGPAERTLLAKRNLFRKPQFRKPQFRKAKFRKVQFRKPAFRSVKKSKPKFRKTKFRKVKGNRLQEELKFREAVLKAKMRR